MLRLKDLREDHDLLQKEIADYLNIGKPNCKSFLKRVNSLGLTKKDIEEIICKIR